MNITEKEKNIYGNDIELVSRNDDCTVYKISNETGNIVMTSYQVFEGIHIIYNDVHMLKCSTNRENCDNIIEINHCREGRIECQFGDEFCYLSEGDMAIAIKDAIEQDSYFPISHYHGISIMIDIKCAPKCLSCILDDVNVYPADMINKFCNGRKCFIMRSKPFLEHIFSELYSVPENIKKGYFKVKILELLLFLSSMDIEAKVSDKFFYSKAQVSLAKNICRYLTEHMESHITIKELSDIFYVSQTQIKTSFKGVYGVSVYSYIRAQKMQAAALLLKKTDYNIIDIAGRCGYDNGSKFANAFKNVIGMSPKKYRNECAHLELNSVRTECKS